MDCCEYEIIESDCKPLEGTKKVTNFKVYREIVEILKAPYLDYTHDKSGRYFEILKNEALNHIEDIYYKIDKWTFKDYNSSSLYFEYRLDSLHAFNVILDNNGDEDYLRLFVAGRFGKFVFQDEKYIKNDMSYDRLDDKYYIEFSDKTIELELKEVRQNEKM